MIQEQVLLQVIDYQMTINSRKEFLVEREELTTISIPDSFALIISGIRRCGKSTLLLLLQKFQNENEVLYINFDNSKLFNFELPDFQIVDKIILVRNKKILFFDEIQVIQGWEVYVRQKLDEGYKVVVTGSNASLLSRELGTKLTGRHFSKELFPFSYAEFLLFSNLSANDSSTELYLQKGGFPEYLKTNETEVLSTLFDDILYRDIAVRYGVRDVHSLKKLALLLISNTGNLVSASKLKQQLSVKSTTTILEYFSYFENSYLVFFVPIFSYSHKVQLVNPRKVYAIDLGLIDSISTTFTRNLEHILENAVYLHLRRKHKEIYYFSQNNAECDFVVVEKGSIVSLIQVCYELNFDNKEREMKGLNSAMDELKVINGLIITFNQTDSYIYNGKKVEIIPAHNFLMI
ncbi:MAG: ATP-binding protein [Paludibacter sp.]